MDVSTQDYNDNMDKHCYIDRVNMYRKVAIDLIEKANTWIHPLDAPNLRSWLVLTANVGMIFLLMYILYIKMTLNHEEVDIVRQNIVPHNHVVFVDGVPQMVDFNVPYNDFYRPTHKESMVLQKRITQKLKVHKKSDILPSMEQNANAVSTMSDYDKENALLCTICLTNMRNVVVVDCQHCFACEKCISCLTNCGICNAEISYTLLFFNS